MDHGHRYAPDLAGRSHRQKASVVESLPGRRVRCRPGDLAQDCARIRAFHHRFTRFAGRSGSVARRGLTQRPRARVAPAPSGTTRGLDASVAERSRSQIKRYTRSTRCGVNRRRRCAIAVICATAVLAFGRRSEPDAMQASPVEHQQIVTKITPYASDSGNATDKLMFAARIDRQAVDLPGLRRGLWRYSV